ncbi:concanavalin A-like lectin/glucanase [Aureobasidium pullulans]|nr:concanavalin A-like lectin/glucanase [Aureobasidium pullulans]
MVPSLLQAIAFMLGLSQLASAQSYNEPYRPQFHFSPKKGWMNDPNGLLYYNGVYHMYYQYNPGGNTWGNISWGHATSRDLTKWEEQPVALLARGYGKNVTEMFFSGSAVADTQNTSGFGKKGKVPFVAMYTSVHPYAEKLPSGKTVRPNQQSQSIAYSLDEGMTWTTYDAVNPVILEPPAAYADQFIDFRDPFVFRHEETKKWVVILSLAQLQKLLIYTSPNLKDWTLASEFGPVNAAGGLWECPSLFPLPLDGKSSNTKWITQIGLNPGGPPGVVGSGTQYVVGSFDGKNFTADADSVYLPPAAPSGSIIFADFEGTSFADLGWTATGDLVGAGPSAGTVNGQQDVTGYVGSSLVNTFLSGDATVGTLTSKSFTISKRYINFLIGGGNALGQEGINLVIGNETVLQATGTNGEKLIWQGWDVSAYKGQNAVLEIVDLLTGGWGHINVDQISFSDTLATPQKANWMDYGPDFYAAVPWNGLPTNERTNVGWMNNWQYAQVIPTEPWRSAMSVPRGVSLQTVNGKAQIVQTAKEKWSSFESRGDSYSKKWSSVPEGTQKLKLDGKTLDIVLTFDDRSAAAGKASRFGIILRASKDLSQQTRIGYDFTIKQLFVDRTKSGNSSFDATFASVYYAPLQATRGGKITMRILLDWSSVEVFGGVGETTLTAQIFPADSETDVLLFSEGGKTKDVSVTAKGVGSAWK